MAAAHPQHEPLGPGCPLLPGADIGPSERVERIYITAECQMFSDASFFEIGPRYLMVNAAPLLPSVDHGDGGSLVNAVSYQKGC